MHSAQVEEIPVVKPCQIDLRALIIVGVAFDVIGVREILVGLD